MKEFKKPDLNAPRYRPKKLNILNNDFCEEFKLKYPQYKSLSNSTIKKVITEFNGLIWQEAINNRDGIEFPEQLGYNFIGSCPRKVGENTNYKRSSDYGVKIQHKNLESDQYTAKIFYTNFENKYRFRFHELWAFKGVRQYTRMVGKTYPIEWKKYIVVDNLTKVSKLFRKEKFKEFRKQQTIQQLENYDEFDMS